MDAGCELDDANNLPTAGPTRDRFEGNRCDNLVTVRAEYFRRDSPLPILEESGSEKVIRLFVIPACDANRHEQIPARTVVRDIKFSEWSRVAGTGRTIPRTTAAEW